MNVTGNVWPWNFILFFATLNSFNLIMVLSNTLKVLGKASYKGRYLQMVSCYMTLSCCLISSLILHTHYFWTGLNIPPSGSKCISCVWFADTVKERLAYISVIQDIKRRFQLWYFLTFIFLYFDICSTKPCICGRVIGESWCSLICFHIHRDAVHHGQLLDCPKEINMYSY